MALNDKDFPRQKELAREYEKRMVKRSEAIRAKAKAEYDPYRKSAHDLGGLRSLFAERYHAAFSANRYGKPSEFFRKEMPWVFDLVVYPRFHEAFCDAVDRVVEYPYGVSWERRSYRSDHYVSYADRIREILVTFAEGHIIDADVRDVLSGYLPEDAVAYLKSRTTRVAGFVPEVLAYGLDRNDPALEQTVTDIINGDSEFSTISVELIRGIVLSHNAAMHALLCRLLVAAKLQEGLRQAICENADWGTQAAFRAILATIAEHDLIRYSSVKRAVGTWIGVISYETSDLDRVSGKTVELMIKCLDDPDFRQDCLESEDSMAIVIALWSAGFESFNKSYRMMKELIANGTHHQVLTAGYFVAGLQNPILRHTSARRVLKSRRDRYDILAVYLPSFLPYHRFIANRISNAGEFTDFKSYFESPMEAEEFCDWLFETYSSLKQKSMAFSPCIFPWYSATLLRSELLEKAMILAVALKDQARIDKLCSYLPDCDPGSRDFLFEILTMGEKTAAVRGAILNGLQDKATDTRKEATKRVQELKLTNDEYLQIEQMLRLRYDDLRRNAIELLLGQEEAAVVGSVNRLLSASKAPMRAAGLDMVKQLQLAGKESLVSACMNAVRAIDKPTTQEKILIDALLPKPVDSEAEVLCTEADRYVPNVELDEYAKGCLRVFTEFFPDSKLEQQTLAGLPVLPKMELIPRKPCKAAAKARENFESLNTFFLRNEKQTFPAFHGESPVGCAIHSFISWANGFRGIPRMDLWEQWAQENSITPAELYAMMILDSAQSEKLPYLAKCASLIRSIYGPGFDKPPVYRYSPHYQRIVYALIQKYVPAEIQQKLATALALWIHRCLPEDLWIGSREKGALTEVPVPEYLTRIQNRRERIQVLAQHYCLSAGHFIQHPQISALIAMLDPSAGEGAVSRIPLILSIYHRTFDATAAYMAEHGKKLDDRAELLLDQIYNDSYRLEKHRPPEISIWLHARLAGVISDRTLYYYLLEPAHCKDALELLTAVCAVHPEEGTVVAAKAVAQYRKAYLRNLAKRFVGEEDTPEEVKISRIALCHRVAKQIVPLVVNTELNRGDSPEKYSAFITGIHVLSGAETFVRILSALGKDTLERSAYYSYGYQDSKRGNLSYLLSRCTPSPEDDTAKLAALLQGTDITEKRLMEAAFYSPSWIDLIGAHLNLTGFKSVCYYFMAHMNEQFDDEKKAIIARYTPLSADELNDGAFDVDWFRYAFQQLGEEKFNLLYDAAKYISDGSKHTRARKYADAALSRLQAGDTEATIKDKRNKDLLMAYAIIPLTGEDDLVHRYLYLQQFRKESRQFGSQRSTSEKKAVEAAMRNLAINAGFSDTMRLTLRMESKLVEDSRELFEDKQIGEWILRLAVDGQGSASVLCTKEGKPLKSIPSKLKKDPYVLRLQELKKQLTEQYRRTRQMFEQAMEDGAEFTLDELRKLWENPVAAPIVSKLIFKSETGLGLFDGTFVVSLTGEALGEDAETRLTVAHPVHLYRSGNWHELQKYLYDHQIIQPIRQVFRELYVKTKEELGTHMSLRYAGNQIQPKKAAACLKERRWVADIEAGLQKIYYQHNIVATIYALADWFTPGEIEAPTLEYVAFYDRKTGQGLKIDDVPDVIFSEVMRDVDMAVSVAHAGGVDPETSHSTVEMRAAILSFTLPLLRLKNVQIQGNHAFIEGKLARYSVHLGSGVIHQIGGAMLSVLPVHSQHRGRFFLPFVDEDPKTAEIISKVILFAEDHKLKDPTILDQISR